MKLEKLKTLKNMWDRYTYVNIICKTSTIDNDFIYPLWQAIPLHRKGTCHYRHSNVDIHFFAFTMNKTSPPPHTVFVVCGAGKTAQT